MTEGLDTSNRVSCLFIIAGILILAFPSGAQGIDDGRGLVVDAPPPVTGSMSPINGSALAQWKESPAPVVILHIETREKNLPGPRYMAFGPVAIDISMSPVVFAAFITLLALLAAAICIRTIGAWGRSTNNDREFR